MIYKKTKNKYFVRLVKGENIFTSLYELIEKEKINCAWINGIGAVENITIGSYNLNKKRYDKKVLNGVFELVSLMGNFSFKEGNPFLHLHVTVSNHDCQAFGGHLFTADINATGEFIIESLDIDVNRIYDNNIGLHLLEFNHCEK